MSLRLRLALVGIVASVVAAAAVAGVSYQLVAGRLSESLDSSLETTSWLFKEEPKRAPTADPFRGQDLGDYAVQALRDDGGTLSLSGPVLPVIDADVEIALGRRQQVIRYVEIDGARWRMLTAATSYGAVQVAVETAESDRTRAALQLVVSVVALAVSALAAAGAWRVTARALSPLEDLTDAVEHIADGRLDVEVVGGRGEVGRLADSFNQTIRALRQSRSEQRRLVQDAGHDLRTPLTSILANVVLLRRRMVTATQQDEMLADIEDEARKLGGLVEQIIAAAAGSVTEEQTEPFDVTAMAVATAGRIARLRERAISVRGAEQPVGAQPRAVERSITNLLENAVKFSDGSIEVEVEAIGDQVWVLVHDRGPGIGDDPGEQLFERFWRSDASRSSDGSGLGLAIVKTVAEHHGGSVRAENRDGGGATIGFSVRRDAGA